MLHIILTILKIIGIILLVVVGLVLFLLAVVLFVPVRYRLSGKKEAETFFVKAEAFWLMHLLRVRALYPEPGKIVVKLLWFTLYDSSEEPKPEKKKKKQSKKKAQTEEIEETEEKESRTESTKKEQIMEEGVKKEDPAQEYPIKGQDTEEYGEKDIDDGEETGKVRGFFEKIKEILRKIKNAVKNIWYTIKRLCDRIVKIQDDISYYMEVFGEEETKQAFLLCRRELFRIWKNIRPAKCRAELTIGTGEPETTGYILAVHGILYPIIGNAIIIEPDFENQVFEGNFFLKGRITVFVLLYAVIKIYFDKNIRYFLKRFKREEV